MGKQIKQINFLSVGKNVVSLINEVNAEINLIEIDYIDPINITSLLPDSFILQHKNNKMLILKTANTAEKPTDLFEYKGNAIITNCFIVYSNLKRYKIPVIKTTLEFWNTLMENEDNTKQDWAYITRNWEDMDFNGNNKRNNYIHRHTTYDEDTRTTTTTKEIRKR